MKLHFLSHPLMQVFSFAIILVASPYFGGPFGYFVYRSFLEGYLYGITGMIAIAISLLSMMRALPYRNGIQFSGLVLMVVSLLIFAVKGRGMNLVSFRHALPLFTLLLFLIVAAAVCRKTFSSLSTF